jgi:hypothetical protein
MKKKGGSCVRGRKESLIGLTRIEGEAILGGTRPESCRRTTDACIVGVVSARSGRSALAGFARHSPIILVSTFLLACEVAGFQINHSVDH